MYRLEYAGNREYHQTRRFADMDAVREIGEAICRRMDSKGRLDAVHLDKDADIKYMVAIWEDETPPEEGEE